MRKVLQKVLIILSHIFKIHENSFHFYVKMMNDSLAKNRTSMSIRKTDLPPRLQPTLWLTPSLAKAPFISLEVRRLLRAPYSTPFKCKHTIRNLHFSSKISTCKVVNWIFETNLTEDFELEIQTRLKSLSVHKREQQYGINVYRLNNTRQIVNILQKFIFHQNVFQAENWLNNLVQWVT